jgi:hypothetical protein
MTSHIVIHISPLKKTFSLFRLSWNLYLKSEKCVQIWFSRNRQISNCLVFLSCYFTSMVDCTRIEHVSIKHIKHCSILCIFHNIGFSDISMHTINVWMYKSAIFIQTQYMKGILSSFYIEYVWNIYPSCVFITWKLCRHCTNIFPLLIFNLLQVNLHYTKIPNNLSWLSFQEMQIRFQYCKSK